MFTGYDAEGVGLSAVEVGQGAVVDRGVAGPHVPVPSRGGQQEGRGRDGVRPGHHGAIVFAGLHRRHLGRGAGG